MTIVYNFSVDIVPVCRASKRDLRSSMFLIQRKYSRAYLQCRVGRKYYYWHILKNRIRNFWNTCCLLSFTLKMKWDSKLKRWQKMQRSSLRKLQNGSSRSTRKLLRWIWRIHCCSVRVERLFGCLAKVGCRQHHLKWS